MFEQIKEASSKILIPTLALYFFGFICITSFLSRFGLSDFDILNARFLIAGLYPSISIAAAATFAWYIYNGLKIGGFITYERAKDRYKFYFTYLFFLYIFSAALSSLFNIGTYIARQDKFSLVFFPILGRYNVIASLLNRMSFSWSIGSEFIVKTAIEIAFALISILTAGIFLFYVSKAIIRIGKAFLKWLRKPSPAASMPPQTDVNQSPATATPQAPPVAIPATRKYVIWVIDLVIISFFVALLIYSSIKLHSSLYDFTSFSEPPGVTTPLLFAWLYDAISLFLFFMHFIKLAPGQLSLQLLFQFHRPQLMPWAIQQFVVPVLAALFLFGSTVFPRIPFSIGGGQPRAIAISLKEDKPDLRQGETYLLGDNSEFVFIAHLADDADKAYAINREAIEYLETKKVVHQAVIQP